jgi:hypothetical protein
MFYRRQPNVPLPHDRTFIVNLDDGTSLRVWASSQLVTIHHHRRLHQEPLWRATFLLADNPGLAALYTPRMGWDLIGLISLMRSEIEHMAQLNLRDPALRAEAGLDTVSIPSHDRSKQEKRTLGQALELIADYVAAHPGCNRLDVARDLHRAKSPHLLAQIEWLVSQKVILREQIIRANGMLEFRYYIAD